MKTLTTLTCLLLLMASSTYATEGSPVHYKAGDTPLEGYFISPGDKAPLIVLVHDWDGLTDYEMTRANMLAKLGYAVFAVDLFGQGVRPTTLEAKKQLTGALYADRARMRELLDAGLKAAEKQAGRLDNVVAIGYCFGGSAVLELARAGAPLKGFVSFHGGLDTPEGEDYSKVRGSVLVFHGSADSSVSLQSFADLAVALEAKGISHEMTTYSGAPHAFTVFGSDRYRKDADSKSWRRFIEYLDETLRR